MCGRGPELPPIERSSVFFWKELIPSLKLKGVYSCIVTQVKEMLHFKWFESPGPLNIGKLVYQWSSSLGDKADPCGCDYYASAHLQTDHLILKLFCKWKSARYATIYGKNFWKSPTARYMSNNCTNDTWIKLILQTNEIW